MNRMQIGERLKTAREQLGISRKEASEYAKIGTTTIQQWEVGSREASLEAIEKLAQLYKVSPNYLIFGEEPNKTEMQTQFDMNQWLRFESTLKKIGNIKMIHALTQIPESVIQSWQSKIQAPTMSQLIEIANITKVSLDWLLMGKGDVEQQSNNNDYSYIPAYDIEASTGAGIFTQGTIQSTRHLAFRTSWLNDKKLQINNLAVIYTKGDSMMPTIPEKSAVLVDMARNQALDGRIYVIRIDDRLYVKRTQWLPTGLRLISDNKDIYAPIDISKAELEHDNIEIIGQVIHVNYDLPD